MALYHERHSWIVQFNEDSVLFESPGHVTHRRLYTNEVFGVDGSWFIGRATKASDWPPARAKPQPSGKSQA